MSLSDDEITQIKREAGITWFVPADYDRDPWTTLSPRTLAKFARAVERAARAQVERERDEALALLRRIRASSVIDAVDGEYWRLAIDALLKRGDR